MPFAHLHVHSHFTLLNSTIAVPKLVGAVKARGMTAAALTDRGNLCGAFEFASACKDAQITGLIGCQLNVAPLGLADKGKDWLNLVLIAASETGYRNLARLVSRGWLEGFFYEPQVDLEMIAAHAGDVVCLTGAGANGFINRHLPHSPEEARRNLELLRTIFPDRLFLEVCDHGDDGPLGRRGALARLAQEANVPAVAANWVHYLDRADARVHEVLLAIEGATTLDDPRIVRKRLPTDEFYLKTHAEMAALFSDLPEAVANTERVVELCKGGKIPSGQYYLPKFPCPDGLDENALLRRDTLIGVQRRYGDNISTEIRERMEFELKTIIEMGFPAYFLIVADFIGWAKKNGIPVGPGRGSAAGSLVSYALGITDMCPLRYGLLFERFLNPGRKSMPDIDIDFCKDGRDRVIHYVAQKYGADAVTQIMTLGTMKARMAIKDVARAYAWTPEESQELANLVPNNPAKPVDLQQALGRKAIDKDGKEWATVDQLAKRYEGDERTRTTLDAAMKVEKLGRSLGVHACGIVIAPGPVSGYIPVCSVKGKPATQFNMTQVEKAGLLKMDFLGLKTMSILKKATDLAQASTGTAIDLLQIPLADPRTFQLLGTGETLGVFQCESPGFQNLIKNLKPDRFEDMIALVALYRPGPLMANMHIDYCERKQGRQRIDYPHPVLERSLKETYGLYIYQEQVMNISRELCGFTPAEADDLRKAMGKKDVKVLEKLEQKFIEGAFTQHQFDRDRCREMWKKILGFASYCFNKSHSACYGLIAYWTAYMKANHYAAFMTANLIYEMGDKDKMTRFVEELKSHRISVLPPDLNESGWEFTIVRSADGPDKIRFGFGGVKGIGDQAAAHLIAKREAGGRFASLYDLCERVDTRVINKRVVEALIKVGALDSLHPNRRALVEAMERAFDRGQKASRTRAQNQQTLFAAFEQDAAFAQEAHGYPDVPDWPVEERLGYEKQLSGYWMSSHPVAVHAPALAAHVTARAGDLRTIATGNRATIAAVVVGKRVVRTRTGKQMGILELEDETGRFEAVLFPGGGRGAGGRRDEPSIYERFGGECVEGLVALFTGTVERRRRGGGAPRAQADEDGGGEPHPDGDDADGGEGGAMHAPDPEPETASLIITDVIPARSAAERLTREVLIAIDGAADPAALRQRLDALATLISENQGETPIVIQVHVPGDVALTLRVGDDRRLRPTAPVLERLRALWGPGRIKVFAKEAANAPMHATGGDDLGDVD